MQALLFSLALAGIVLLTSVSYAGKPHSYSSISAFQVIKNIFLKIIGSNYNDEKNHYQIRNDDEAIIHRKDHRQTSHRQ